MGNAFASNACRGHRNGGLPSPSARPAWQKSKEVSSRVVRHEAQVLLRKGLKEWRAPHPHLPGLQMCRVGQNHIYIYMAFAEISSNIRSYMVLANPTM